MIVVKITDEIIAKAKERADKMGELRNSIRKGEGNLVGFVGEEVFIEYFGGELCDTYEFDVLINGRKIDLKTKEVNTQPLPHYLASVADYNTRQECDSYYFVRVNFKTMEAYLLGGLPKKTFYEHAIVYQKGEPDPSDPIFRFKATCHNVPLSLLKNP